MFRPHIWEIIHNRFKNGSDLRWTNDMSARDWWIQGAFGDPSANDENMIWDGPVRASFAGFLERLHRAYNGDLNYFADPDEWSWYQEWVEPFHDPLSPNYLNTAEGLDGFRTPYSLAPEDYFGNLRNYMENEAPAEWFEEGFDWSWEPYIPYTLFHSAINKKVM
jgi:hypothetical protein